MGKNTLFLPELEDALQYWEDVNLYSEVFFQLMKTGRIDNNEEFNPLIGSEVNKEGLLMRAIKNFKGFRSTLENYIKTDALQYLPRVPKDLRDKEDILDFMRTHCFGSITPLPYMLNRWMESKKVFMIDRAESIPLMETPSQYYLNKLPHEAFIIKFEEPITIKRIFKDVFKDTEPNGEQDYDVKIALISSNTNKVDVMFIPDLINKFVMGNDDRNLFNEYLKKPTEKLFRKLEKVKTIADSLFFTGFSIDTESALPLLKVWREDNEEKLLLADLYTNPQQIIAKPELSLEEIEKHVKEVGHHTLNTSLVDLINGFCKVISELPIRKRIVVEEESQKRLPEIHEDFQWNAVHIGEVRNLNEDPDAYLIKIKYGTGSEKGPHVRRGHIRRYGNKEIWIPEAMVRADKLEEENLQGNATLIKSE